jgi:hypothetical protein
MHISVNQLSQTWPTITNLVNITLVDTLIWLQVNLRDIISGQGHHRVAAAVNRPCC